MPRNPNATQDRGKVTFCAWVFFLYVFMFVVVMHIYSVF